MGTERETGNYKIEKILSEAGIRPTPARKLILKMLMEADHPLSAQEIDDSLETLDRSSITRTLPILNESHLIHQISDGSGAMKYELCKGIWTDQGHDDQHIHFHCNKCGRTLCLQHLEIVIPPLPEGFYIENVTYVIHGICPQCNSL